jgi:hypothetical protein
MTLPHRAEPVRGIPDLPDDRIPVLLDRPITPGARRASVFVNDRWDLTPCLFEEHASAISVNFHAVPEAFRVTIKHYLWQMINHDPPRAQPRTNGPRPAIRTVYAGFFRAVAFVTWAHTHQIARLADAEPAVLDRYLDFVAGAEISHDSKEAKITPRCCSWDSG